nr:MAG TPA: hypothetical protein [Caudoviricetes sp.]DAL28020.1 MAG TPA_asm: hypothetical protein [Caudoviricetes sp.]
MHYLISFIWCQSDTMKAIMPPLKSYGNMAP